MITQKNRYAIRAVYELARQYDSGPVKSSKIAEAQKIPPRFLEVILNHLKKSGLLEAKRGFVGGYFLKVPPEKITIGRILRAMEGKEKVYCVSCISKKDCELMQDCSFLPMWEEVNRAIMKVLDNTTIKNLLDGKSLDETEKSIFPPVS